MIRDPIPAKEAAMNTADAAGTNRRTYIRLSYAPDRRPTLLLKGDRFSINDISESGLRLDNPRQAALPRSFQARIKLLGGAVMDIRADVQWQENGEVGISLAELIPPSVIKEEQRRLILDETVKSSKKTIS